MLRTSSQSNSIRSGTLLVGTFLVVSTQYWVTSTWNGFTLASLFINAIVITFILGLLNVLLLKVRTSAILRPSELMLVYIMLTSATAAAGHDTLEILTQIVAYPVHFASPENDWKSIFFHYLPTRLVILDPLVAEGLIYYDESFFSPHIWPAWVQPILLWSLFTILLYFSMIFLSLLLRRQWINNELLTFPIAQIPLQLLSPRRSIYQNKKFWFGFLVTSLLSLNNGIHHLVPVVPGLTYGKYNLAELFPEPPWSAIEVAYIEILPFVTGLAFFIPTKLSFSIWFFYWFWKLINVTGQASGLHQLPYFPGYWIQGLGGMAIFGIMFLYWARRHLIGVFKVVFTSSKLRSVDDTPYFLAVWGFLISTSIAIVFLVYAGMSLLFAILFLAGFFGLTVVTTRLRAQVGPPTHEIPFTVSGFLSRVISTRYIDNRTLTQFSLFMFVDFGQRGSPMPQIMEGFYLQHRLHSRQIRIVVVGIVAALILGTVIGFVGNLERAYRLTNKTWAGEETFSSLVNQIQNKTTRPDLVYLSYFSLGGGIVFALAILSRRYIWWSFHPLGYIIGQDWMLRHLWFPIFIAWLIRWTLIKFSGLKGLRNAIPIFLGITIGDATCILLWKTYAIIFNQQTLDWVYW